MSDADLRELERLAEAEGPATVRWIRALQRHGQLPREEPAEVLFGPRLCPGPGGMGACSRSAGHDGNCKLAGRDAPQDYDGPNIYDQSSAD